MPRPIAPRPSVFLACSIAILCCCVDARAQSLDANFDPGANQIVNTIAVQPDGKIVVGGNFTGLGGGTGTTPRNRIGRLYADGTVDTNFNPGTNGPVLAVAVQPDGKILAGGNFTLGRRRDRLDDVAKPHRAVQRRWHRRHRLQPGREPERLGPRACSRTGRSWSAASSTTLGGALRNAIGRLNTDGSIDTVFNPGATKTFGNANRLHHGGAAGREDRGRRLLQRARRTGDTRNFIGRINADGTVDSVRSRRHFHQRRQRAGAPGRREDPGRRHLYQARPRAGLQRRRATSAGSTPTARVDLRLQSRRGNPGSHAGRAD